MMNEPNWYMFVINAGNTQKRQIIVNERQMKNKTSQKAK